MIFFHKCIFSLSSSCQLFFFNEDGHSLIRVHLDVVDGHSGLGIVHFCFNCDHLCGSFFSVAKHDEKEYSCSNRWRVLWSSARVWTAVDQRPKLFRLDDQMFFVPNCSWEKLPGPSPPESNWSCILVSVDALYQGRPAHATISDQTE